ncbi:MAG: DUF1924 domain-containing protein [Thiobacillaceae bacterium]
MLKIKIASLALWTLTMAAHAATPQEILKFYLDEAARAQPGFTASTQRGARFYRHPFNHNAVMPACKTCHTDNPTRPGQHVVTGKDIKPLSPRTNADRFTDPAKVAKWFRRNCTEVLGRECSAAEKADLISYLMEAN